MFSTVMLNVKVVPNNKLAVVTTLHVCPKVKTTVIVCLKQYAYFKKTDINIFSPQCKKTKPLLSIICAHQPFIWICKLNLSYLRAMFLENEMPNRDEHALV